MNLTKPVAEAELRASDADRDRIAEILREALAVGRLDAEEHSERIDLVYRAKTMGELEPLIRDLPAEGGAPRPAATAYEAEPGGALPDQTMVAIFSASTRKGRWRVPGRINAVAVFGSVEIDLTEGIFQQQRVQINVTAIFGSVEIRVPENVTLRSSGSGVLGAFEVETNESVDTEAPVVVVNGYAVLGSVEAKPKRGKWLRDLRDDLRGARRAWQEQRSDERWDRYDRRRERFEHRRDERRERHARWHGGPRD
ncbi:DUF1707 domain-containing protein [Streptomyces sp. NPDC052496]|uniref:DUF1707 SHOCT-like domain-containing protein n=1 Tax=Streptomyces sp. NPDC052496 TaxID=3154951 RepID=UPI0034125FD8